MRWGKRHYHRESYLTRQHAKYKRRLKKQLIPGYGRHRKGSIKQWQNRVHERYYRQHTYPSYSERLRMWGEGYNPHPRRRTYTSSYRKTSRRRPKTSTHSRTASDDDNDDGCLGCGCLSFILAVFFGASASSYSLFFFVFFLCLIIYAIFAHHAKMHSKNKSKPKSKDNPKSSAKSETSSSNSSQASASSASSNPLQAQSLTRSTADSLQNVMDSVVAKSNEGHGFDSYSVHHSIHQAESSMKSIYPSGDAHRSYTMSLLSGMYSDVTQAGKEFSPNASATVSIHFSVDGNDSSSSSNHSSSSTYTSNRRDKD